jgi:nicotinamidase-related amidase
MPPPPTLLVIDLQAGIVDGDPEWGRRSTPSLTTNVSKILDAWRTRKWPIIHIHHNDPDPDHPLNVAHAETFKAHSCSEPVEGEVVLVKQVGSAFIDHALKLEARLREHAGEIVVIGMDGSQCINNNTRNASDLGFKVTVIADACSTYGMDDYKSPGEKISADDTHDAAMGMLANGFAKVTMTEEFLRQLEVR